jgi:hypothetical protein
MFGYFSNMFGYFKWIGYFSNMLGYFKWRLPSMLGYFINMFGYFNTKYGWLRLISLCQSYN